MSYHATNSSHVTDHLLSSLLSVRYMCCVACCWKSCLTPAVLYWKTPAASVSLLPRRPPRPARRPPRVRARMLAHFMVRLYIAVVCSYGEALADRIVSYRIAIFCVISYRIYRFLLWLYRAITNPNLNCNDTSTNTNLVCTVKYVVYTLLRTLNSNCGKNY